MCLLFITAIITKSVTAQEPPKSFDRAYYYSVMAKDNLSEVETLLKMIKNNSFGGKQAFEGTLLMKKAGLVGGAKIKMNLFKSGHKELENELNKDSLNAEYRFLRLMIQEHAPSIVNYRNKLKEDSIFIRKTFKQLPPVVQHAIVDYSKKSKVLKLQDS